MEQAEESSDYPVLKKVFFDGLGDIPIFGRYEGVYYIPVID
ncbi:MAG: hypothetical protein Q4D99_07425 [Bacillota bacterium]|nr:hypothetical protein [Bacillota bacterium]